MAQLVILVVHDLAKVDEILQAWLEVGASGMTIFDSSGWAQQLESGGLRDDLPLFPSVRSVLLGDERTNRTLMSVVSEDFDIEQLIVKTEQVLGSLDEAHSGILLVLPVTEVRGLRP